MENLGCDIPTPYQNTAVTGRPAASAVMTHPMLFSGTGDGLVLVLQTWGLQVTSMHISTDNCSS